VHFCGRWAVVSAGLACFLAFARLAQAEPLPIELSWEAPSECPTREEVMSELTRITRVRPGRVVTPISAQAKIERAASGRYQLRLRTQREDQTGDTDLDAATCPVLKRGVTLVLALTLGDGVDLVDEAAEPVPDAAPAATAPVTVTPKRAPSPRRRSQAAGPKRAESALRVAPWLSATVAWALTAKPALGAQLGLELGQVHWLALAQTSYFPARSATTVAGVGSSYSALIGALGGCGRAPFAGWALAACASFELGIVHGQAAGAFRDGSANAPWYAVGPSLVLETPLAGPLQLRIAGGLSVAFEPPRFAIRGLRDVYAASRYIPALSLGVSL